MKNTTALLEIKDLKVFFPLRRSISEFFHRTYKYAKAVDGASFEIFENDSFGLVGESGCGKTTTGKAVMKLVKPSSGSIRFEGKETSDELSYRKKVQMIFQDPYASLNPQFRIREILEEPLLIHKIGKSRLERFELIKRALEEVKLSPVEEYLSRFPHMLSGGQRQRVGVARTLILQPELVVADEPVSMLDLSIRAEMLQLMKDLQKTHKLSYLYISHDISTTKYFTDRIAVMYLGKIVETGKSKDVIDNPKHPYTKALLSAVPEPIPERIKEIKKIPIKGEVTSATNIPPGCRFHPRCPYTMEICKKEEPQYRDIGGGHLAACHLI